MNCVKAHLPVAASFGFTTHLRTLTHGKAFPQCIFSHWDTVMGDPFEEGSYSNKLVLSIRKRKGVKEALPLLENYYDKL